MQAIPTSACAWPRPDVSPMKKCDREHKEP